MWPVVRTSLAEARPAGGRPLGASFHTAFLPCSPGSQHELFLSARLLTHGHQVGKTVQSSFDIAKAMVRADPKVLRSDENEKFLLLPESMPNQLGMLGCHFDAAPSLR